MRTWYDGLVVVLGVWYGYYGLGGFSCEQQSLAIGGDCIPLVLHNKIWLGMGQIYEGSKYRSGLKVSDSKGVSHLFDLCFAGGNDFYYGSSLCQNASELISYV